MAGLRDRILKSSNIKEAALLSKSTFFQNRVQIPMDIPVLNIALSGSLDGGLTGGHTAIGGPSRHFKTQFALAIARSFQKHYADSDNEDDGMVVWFDSEFGSPQEYFEQNDIDMDKVIHVPITTIEELRSEMANQLKNLTRDDKVIFIVDSLGFLSSEKEIENAENEHNVADMQRGKTMKSAFRVVTSRLKKFDIPLITINHTYQTMEMFSKEVISGGTGITLSADNIWFIGRRQVKDKKTKEVLGYQFIIKSNKSRFLKEGSDFDVDVSWEDGVSKWSGLFRIASELGYIQSPSKGYYEVIDMDTGEVLFDKKYRKADIEKDDEVWTTLIEKTGFKKAVEDRYVIKSGDDIEDEQEDGEDE